MRLTLPTEHLREILDATRPAITGRTHPILDCVRLTATTFLQASATNGDFWIDSETGANVEQAGAVCVQHKRACDAAHAFKGEVVELLVENKALKMTCGKAMVKLPTLEATEFTDAPVTGLGSPVALTQHVHFRKLLGFASTDPSRAELNSVYLGSGWAVCAMGYTLLAVEQAGLDLDLMIPSEVASPVANWKSEVITLRQSESLMQLAADGLTITSKKLAGRFPNWTIGVPAKETVKHLITCPREDLLWACKTAMLVGDERKYDSIRLDFTPGRCHVFMQGKEQGEAGEEIECDAKEPFCINFAPKYLLPILRAFEGETVTLGFVDAISPLVIRQEGMIAVALPNRVA